MKKLILADSADAEVVTIDPARLVEVSEVEVSVDGRSYSLVNRTDGPFEGKAFYLGYEFDWVIGEDSEGAFCLVPLGKS